MQLLTAASSLYIYWVLVTKSHVDKISQLAHSHCFYTAITPSNFTDSETQQACNKPAVNRLCKRVCSPLSDKILILTLCDIM